MGYDAGDDHGQSKEGPQKHDDEGADGGEEKSVSGSIGSDGKQNRQSSAGWTQGVLYCLLNTAKDRPERRSFLHGRSEVIRTPGILLPNLCLNLQAELSRTLWRFPSLLRFLFETLLPCLFQTQLSSFGICVGLNSVY